MLAVYGSIIEYFLHRRLTWEESEEVTGYKPGTAAWSVGVLPRMEAMGFNVHMIEPFDYARYANEGETYLQKIYTPEQLTWYKENSNILAIRERYLSF